MDIRGTLRWVAAGAALCALLSARAAEPELPPQEQPAEEQSYDKTTWGMSTEQVRELYGDVEDINGGIAREATIAGLDALVVFRFTQDQLTMVQVYFRTDHHTNDNLSISDYTKIKELLQKKYGTPSKSDVLWTNDLYQDDPDHYGMAVSIGHLFYINEWKVEGMKISHGLLGDSYKITHEIDYASTRLADLKDQADEEKNLEGL